MLNLIYFILFIKNVFMLGLYIFIWVVVVLGIFAISGYNKMVFFRNTRDESFANIDVQLKQRFDLIPNLMESVKWYMAHERDTLESLTKARTSFLQATDVNGKIAADNMLAWALKSVFAVAENYPDLKANQNFMQFQQELADIENKISAARRFFNNATKEYNTFIQMFPNNILAWMFHFNKEPMYEIWDEAQRENVVVKF